jgi:hypothetical protein
MKGKKKGMKQLYPILLVAGISCAEITAQTQQVEIEATMDNSIFEEGALSNGIGHYLFTGRIRTGEKRRSLIKFDPASVIPAGVTIDSARLVLTPSKVKTGGTEITIYKLTTEWGEAGSDAGGEEGQGGTAQLGDATWADAKIGINPWVKPGGDYELESPVKAIVNLDSKTVFTSPVLAEMVNGWLSSPAQNHGWIVIGDESASSTAIRFISRENDEVADRPTLVLFYQGSTLTPSEWADGNHLRVFRAQEAGTFVIFTGHPVKHAVFEIWSITGQIEYKGHLTIPGDETMIQTGITRPGIYLYRFIRDGTVVSGKLLIRD